LVANKVAPAPDYDLIIIGGGINGTAIARDAALRGLRTCLVEQDDLCAGTTRWSSRLVHGGLRYLEHGELGLVHESLREREILFRQAPHLVQPLPLLIPVYGHSSRGLNTISFGLWLYGMLAGRSTLPGHRRLDDRELEQLAPGLDRAGLAGALLYYDGQVSHVERLVVENALAARAAGADILLHTRVEALLLDGRRIHGVRCVARLSGAVQEIRARAVINAAGPWVDRLLGTLPRRPARLMGPTRGTHIVVPAFTGAPAAGCYLEARSDRRPFFILPWNGMVLIGTTDIRDDGDPGAAQASAAEISYLLEETTQVFPAAGLGPHSVLWHYTGLRPLPRQGRRLTGSISRRHQLRHHAPLARGLYSVVGGKITTCRSLAEDAVDQVVRRLRISARPCQTATEPLPGCGDRSAILAALAHYPAISPASRQHLWDIYGARATAVAALLNAAPELAQPICPHSHAIGAEVVFAMREELAVHLTDILFGRCMAALSPDLGAAAMSAALPIAARTGGWNQERQQAELHRYQAACGQLQVGA